MNIKENIRHTEIIICIVGDTETSSMRQEKLRSCEENDFAESETFIILYVESLENCDNSDTLIFHQQ